VVPHIEYRRSAKRRNEIRYPDASRRQPSTRPQELARMARVYPLSLVTVQQAAELAGVAPGTIRTWAHRGRLARAPDSRPRGALFRIQDLYAATRA
jgi:hypothetical protein